MKTSQIFIISTIIIGVTFFGVMSLFELPQSVMGWVLSDIILAVYVGYLAVTFITDSTKSSVQYPVKKVAA
jgi:hypothetical protein